MTTCRFPDNTPSTGYKYGCRCDRCKTSLMGHKRHYGVCTCGSRTYDGSATPPSLCRVCWSKQVGVPGMREKARPHRELVEHARFN